MSDHRSVKFKRAEVENEAVRSQVTTSLHELLRELQALAFKRDPKLKDWLIIIGKGRKLSIWHITWQRDQPQSLWGGDHIARDPQLTWVELEELLVGEYADEGMAVEAMRSLIKLAQMKGKSPRELGVRVTKLSAFTFPEEIRENVAIQVQLVDLYVEATE